MQRIKLHGSGAPNFSYSSKTRAKPTTIHIYETISWPGCGPPGVVSHLEISVGSTAPLIVKERGVE